MAEGRKDVDIETLRILVAVQETGSVSAAARRSGISQPAATARLKEFEARWRLAVVRRSTRGSTLTTDGEAVVAWARTVLHATDQMRAGLEALSVDRASALTVAASLTVAEFVLPRWLGELHAAHPEVRPRLQVVNSDRVADLVRAGEADVGFIETAARPTDLARRAVGSDRLLVVVDPRHPWARRRSAVPTAELRA
ncbi:MAG TPA: LysR substrate-binding domain-containing protein, partial [Nocardioides sp.]